MMKEPIYSEGLSTESTTSGLTRTFFLITFSLLNIFFMKKNFLSFGSVAARSLCPTGRRITGFWPYPNSVVVLSFSIIGHALKSELTDFEGAYNRPNPPSIF